MRVCGAKAWSPGPRARACSVLRPRDVALGARNAAYGLVACPLRRRVTVEACEGRERDFGFPGHVGVGVTVAIFVDLDHAVTGHIKVLSRIMPVRQAIARKAVYDNGTVALSCSDLHT